MSRLDLVPAIESRDGEWVVCNYLDVPDVRFTGSFEECEEFLGRLLNPDEGEAAPQ